MGPQLGQDLSPVVGGMVDDLEKDVLDITGKGPSLGVGIFHPLLEIMGIGHDLKGGALVVVMDVPPNIMGMDLPKTILRCLPQDPLVPDVVGIQNMAEQPLALPWYGGHGPALLDQELIAKKIVIEELL